MPAAIVSSIACRPGSVAGILMKRFGRSTSACRRLASEIVVSASYASVGSTSSETQPSLPLREQPEDRLGIVVLGAQLADLVVVRIAFGDRALEDRRVRRDAHDALLDQPGEVAVLDEATREIVDPDARAVLTELLERSRSHVGLSFRRRAGRRSGSSHRDTRTSTTVPAA
jgi:hypothetical protein